MPLWLGLSGASTGKAREARGERAAWLIDSYLIASHYYVRPQQRGLLQHFAALADHAAWPVVLHNISYRTAVNLDNDTLLALAEHPNIVGMKDCGVCRAQSILLQHRPAGFRLLTGEDAQYFDALKDSADGAIGPSAHFETDIFAAVHKHLTSAEREVAEACWRNVS